MEELDLRIPSALNQLREVRTWAENKALHLGFSEQEAKDVGLCLHEALTNAVVHGHRLDESKAVQVRFSVTEDYLQISVRDQGCGFDVSTVLQQLQHVPTGDQPRGRGLLLMMKLMDEVAFCLDGREIHLCKARPGKPHPQK